MVYSAKSDVAGTISQFTRRKNITINTNGTSTPSLYQIKLAIAYEPQMQASFQDIRFNTRGNVYIDYWIESFTASSTATVWLELPNAITDPGSDSIWMYYGNAAVSDGGSIGNTFDFGDDYTGVTIDVTKWAVVGTNNYITQNNELIISNGTNIWGETGLYSVGSFNRSFIYQTKFKNIVSPNICIGVKDADTGVSYANFVYGVFPIDIGMRIYEDATERGTIAPGFATDTYYWLKIEVFATGAKYYSSTNNIDWSLRYTSAYSTETPLKIGAGAYDAGIILDNTFIRKYIAIEPTATLGTAQHQRRIPTFL